MGIDESGLNLINGVCCKVMTTEEVLHYVKEQFELGEPGYVHVLRFCVVDVMVKCFRGLDCSLTSQSFGLLIYSKVKGVKYPDGRIDD